MKAKTWFIFLVMLIISLTFGCNDVGNDINNSNQDNTYEDNDYDNSSNNQSSYSVYFYTESWNEVYMYAWDESGSNGSWPGVKMSYDGDGWYKGSVNYANVIFNNNSEQTVDLVSQNGYFVPENKNFEGKYEGTWYSTKPNMSNDDGSDSGYNDDYNSDDYLEAPTLTGWYSSELKTIALNWDEIENAKSYDVYMSKTNSSSTAVYCDSETKNFIRISDNKAEKNTTYYFWVKAVNGSVYSDFSNCVEIYVSEENTNTDTDTNNPSDDNGSNAPSDEDDEIVEDLAAPKFVMSPVIVTEDGKGLQIRIATSTIDSRAKKFRLYRSLDQYDNYELVKEYSADNFSGVFEDKSVDMVPDNIYYYRASAVCGTTEAKTEKGVIVKITYPKLIVSAKSSSGTVSTGTYCVTTDEGDNIFDCVLTKSMTSRECILYNYGTLSIWYKKSTADNWKQLNNKKLLLNKQYKLNVITNELSDGSPDTSGVKLFQF